MVFKWRFTSISNMAKLLEENTIKKRLYTKLCQESDDVVILEWKGRLERRRGQRRIHRSIFDGQFDLAVFKRTTDREISPLLIGYEVKGLQKTIRRRDGKVIYRKPRPHVGIGQTRVLLEADANQAYLVSLPRDNDSENESLMNMIEDNPSMGLIFVKVKDRRVEFETIIKPSETRASINQDRKKVNLGIVSVWEEPWSGKMRRQKWARKAEFVLPS